MLTVKEVQELAKKTPVEVYLKIRGLELQEAVKWIREFQEAQANYSRVVGKLDGTAIRLQEIYLMVYKKVMRAYILWFTKRVVRDQPWLPKVKAKNAARVAFGEYMKGVTY